MSRNDDPELRLDLLPLLWALKRGDARLCPEYGLCWHLTEYCADYKDRARAKNWLLDWPEHTGNPMYPVPGPAGQRSYAADPELAYDFSENKWAGEYGGNRMRLLNYLIRRAESA